MRSPAQPAQPGIALGALISQHPQSVVGSRGRMIQSYVALGIGAMLLLAGLVAFVIMAEAAGQGALICLGFGGFCALGIGLLGVLDARKTRDMSLSLYDHGLHYVDRFGEKIWTWDQIEAIHEHRTINQQTRVLRSSYQVVDRNGDSVVFYDHIRQPTAAIATIRQKTSALLLPKISATIATGQPVSFGAITLTPAGLAVKGQTIAWSEIAGIQISGTLLMIDRHGSGWFDDLELNLGDVANAELLQQISAQRFMTASS